MNIFTLTGRILVDNAAANNSISDTSQNADELANRLGSGIKKVGEFALKIGTVIAGVATSVGGLAVKITDDFNGAINSLQVQTGATNEEIEGMSESLRNIYENNYGDSFEDIADSMGLIKTQTDLSGEALENATASALMLRDVFEFDVSESTRAANQLIKEFGISAEEAYTLIAQGAQNGLNANGDMLDVINEYSVHFEQMGFSSEEMFNMLINGAESGTFSIDKLGDAVKEFGIRAQDGSKTTSEAFEILGLDAEEMQKKFAEGGEVANKAFDQVTNALINCDDRISQNTAGVNLFGTMWEDLGVDAITSLTDVNGTIDKTKSTLDDINEVKYDDIGSAIEGLKRMIEVNLLLPLGQDLMPVINNLINSIKNHMPEIKQVFQTTVEAISNTLSGLIDNLNVIIPLLAGLVGGFIAFKTITFVSGIITTLTTVIGGASSATAIFNAILAANPIGIVCIAIGGLIAAIGLLIANWEDVSKWCGDLWDIISDTFTNICDSVGEWFSDIIDTVKEWFKDLIGWFKDLPSEFFNLGKDIFNGLWEGIKDIWNNISSWVSDKIDWLVDKITFWDNGKGKIESETQSVSTVDGSHANGLEYVPFDGYIAELHRGETVLTAKEAEQYRNGTNQVSMDMSETNSLLKTLCYEFKEMKRAYQEQPRQIQRLAREGGY